MDSAQTMRLKWNAYEDNLRSSLETLRNEEDFLDLTLVCAESQVEVHKVILSACSPFFRNILRRNHHQHPLLYLNGVKYSHLLYILDFIYTGEVNVPQEELVALLVLAKDLQVKGLSDCSTSSSDESQTHRKKRSLSEAPADQRLPPVKQKRLTSSPSLSRIKVTEVQRTSQNSIGDGYPLDREGRRSLDQPKVEIKPDAEERHVDYSAADESVQHHHHYHDTDDNDQDTHDDHDQPDDDRIDDGPPGTVPADMTTAAVKVEPDFLDAIPPTELGRRQHLTAVEEDGFPLSKMVSTHQRQLLLTKSNQSDHVANNVPPSDDRLSNSPVMLLEDCSPEEMIKSSQDFIVRLDREVDQRLGKVDGQWTCLVCSYRSTKNMKGHVTEHIEAKHVVIPGFVYCRHCQRAFINRVVLRRHKKACLGATKMQNSFVGSD